MSIIKRLCCADRLRSASSRTTFSGKAGITALLAILTASLIAPDALAAPDPARYGQLPRYDSFAISPNGKRIAYIYRENDEEKFIVQEVASRDLLFVGDAAKFKALNIQFATDKHVILFGSETRNEIGYHFYENTGSISLNVDTGEFNHLLRRTENLHPAQTGLGRLDGINRQKNLVYMSAFTAYSNGIGATTSSNPFPLNLYVVHLDSGIGKIEENGTPVTIRWLIAPDAGVIVREDFLDKGNIHRILSNRSGDWKTIYEENINFPQLRPISLSNDGQFLYLKDYRQVRDARLVRLSLDTGAIDKPYLAMNGAGIERVVEDADQSLVGVSFAALKLAYQFIDPELSAVHSRIEELFPNSSVELRSLSEDKQSLIFFVTGPEATGEFFLYQGKNGNLIPLGKQYEVAQIAPVQAIRLPARDGLKLSAILTTPPDSEIPSKLPAIVIANAPYSYTNIHFDWLSQFLAIKGYLVVQPNVRGFVDGLRHPGEWGTSMQNDISDTVTTLAKAGYIDPQRTCILGNGYAGYSALAGGAFTPQLYRCVISINGISDLEAFINTQKRKYQPYDDQVKYWQELIEGAGDKKDVRQQSPIHYPINNPVLLIHSNLNTVVPVDQSKAMKKALTERGNPVTYVELAHGDHWLATSASRLQALQAIDRFLDQHNPVGTAASAPAE